MKLRTAYLTTYNGIACGLWLYILLQLSIACLQSASKNETVQFQQLWHSTSQYVMLAQTMALLEFVHNIIGLVRGHAGTTLTQIMSRLNLVWILWRLHNTPGLNSAFIVVTLIAWSIADSIRYIYYICQINSINIYAIKWLRYTLFLVLYPIGISGEVSTIVTSLSYLQMTPQLRGYPVPMPNQLNFHLDLYNFYRCLLVLYIPASIHLYKYMLRQRSKAVAY